MWLAISDLYKTKTREEAITFLFDLARSYYTNNIMDWHDGITKLEKNWQKLQIDKDTRPQLKNGN